MARGVRRLGVRHGGRGRRVRIREVRVGTGMRFVRRADRTHVVVHTRVEARRERVRGERRAEAQCQKDQRHYGTLTISSRKSRSSICATVRSPFGGSFC
jgi:hypothetical protein